MPSRALTIWQNDRIPRLLAVDAQCAATLAVVLPTPQLVDENLRGFVVLLSAHFQGFCRDLYTESAQIITSKVRKSLQLLLQEQFSAHRKLDHGNPNIENIESDFRRFGFEVEKSLKLNAAIPPHLTNLRFMNKWRNTAAHHGLPPVGGILLTLPNIQSWQNSCNAIAVSLDRIMYNRLRKILRRQPWVP